MTDSDVKFNLSITYNASFLWTLLPIFDITSIITTFSSILLIAVIITKTPKKMQNFKTFLLPYSCITLLSGAIFGFYGPILLHPFVCIYPIGYARFLSPTFSKLAWILFYNLAMAVIDSCTAMSMERYFAMKNLASSKIPFRIYCFLIILNFVTFFVMIFVMFWPPMKDEIFFTGKNLSYFMSQHFTDYGIISGNIDHLIVFSDTRKGNLPKGFIALIAIGIFHFSIAQALLFRNIRLSRTLKITRTTTTLNKNSGGDMLLRMTFIEFFGMFIFMGFNAAGIMSLFIFVPEPLSIGNYFITLINGYWLYDVIITIIFIKPYRRVFIVIFKRLFCSKMKLLYGGSSSSVAPTSTERSITGVY